MSNGNQEVNYTREAGDVHLCDLPNADRPSFAPLLGFEADLEMDIYKMSIMEMKRTRTPRSSRNSTTTHVARTSSELTMTVEPFINTLSDPTERPNRLQLFGQFYPDMGTKRASLMRLFYLYCPQATVGEIVQVLDKLTGDISDYQMLTTDGFSVLRPFADYADEDSMANACHYILTGETRTIGSGAMNLLHHSNHDATIARCAAQRAARLRVPEAPAPIAQASLASSLPLVSLPVSVSDAQPSSSPPIPQHALSPPPPESLRIRADQAPHQPPLARPELVERVSLSSPPPPPQLEPISSIQPPHQPSLAQTVTAAPQNIPHVSSPPPPQPVPMSAVQLPSSAQTVLTAPQPTPHIVSPPPLPAAQPAPISAVQPSESLAQTVSAVPQSTPHVSSPPPQPVPISASQPPHQPSLVQTVSEAHQHTPHIVSPLPPSQPVTMSAVQPSESLAQTVSVAPQSTPHETLPPQPVPISVVQPPHQPPLVQTASQALQPTPHVLLSSSPPPQPVPVPMVQQLHQPSLAPTVLATPLPISHVSAPPLSHQPLSIPMVQPLPVPQSLSAPPAVATVPPQQPQHVLPPQQPQSMPQAPLPMSTSTINSTTTSATQPTQHSWSSSISTSTSHQLLLDQDNALFGVSMVELHRNSGTFSYEGQMHTFRWFLSTGPARLVTPIYSQQMDPQPAVGDIFFHKTAPEQTFFNCQVWYKKSETQWQDITRRYAVYRDVEPITHPLCQARVLSAKRSDGSPNWILRETWLNYRRTRA
uniref:Uncharacterized protein n=1 Tax=Psilocybe cubensis TaxID=181762 RepID=A0A8H7XM38_PSICU